MEIHQIKKEILPNGTIVIDDLPFEVEVGEVVKITLEKTPKKEAANPYPLRGTPYTYDDPFSPLLDPKDWKPFE